MKLNIREKIWCLLFKFKFIRKHIFYKLARYKEKLKSLDKLKLDLNSFVIDIGGNNGVVSYYILDKFECNIDIYEPNPYCVLILNKTQEIKQIILDFQAYHMGELYTNHKDKKVYGEVRTYQMMF